MENDRPEVPIDDLRVAAGSEADAHAALGAFQAEYARDAPDRERLEAHASRLRAIPGIVAPFERWWLDPRVQAFVSELNATGL
jgi:hypothetical protein